MIVQEVAGRLITLCRAGKIMEAYQELYHPNILSAEPEGFTGQYRIRGMAAIQEKLGQVAAAVQEVHETTTSEPIIAADHFALRWRTEMTYVADGGERGEDHGGAILLRAVGVQRKGIASRTKPFDARAQRL